MATRVVTSFDPAGPVWSAEPPGRIWRPVP